MIRTETDGRLPVCLLTGFLGAGKSTLLNFVLRHPDLQGTAVVINEYGAVGVDHHLVTSSPADTELVAGGCLCCTASGQLSTALLRLFERAQRRRFSLRRVVIETTGLAEPGPILQELDRHPPLAERFVVDSVVTLVDAFNAGSTLASHDIAVQQVAAADRLLLTKTDLAGPAETAAVTARLHRINPDARLDVLDHGHGIPDLLFSRARRRATTGLDLGTLFAAADRIRLNTPGGLAPMSPMVAAMTARAPADQDIQTFSLIFEEPLAPSTFYGWLEFLRTLCGPTLLRFKGLVNLRGQAAPLIVHGVQNALHPTTFLDAWPDGDRRTRLVFITRGWGQDVIASTLDWLRTRVPAAATG